jgi:tetratricopeptide (TPR) repeat protein
MTLIKKNRSLKTRFIVLGLTSLLLSCTKNLPEEKQIATSNPDEIIETYLKNGAWKHNYLTREWGEWIDKGLEKDSTIAYLWQQKAMPLWKKRKYELALKYYNNAVKYNRERYLSRRGFLKCIFQKEYANALIDFNTYKKEYGFTYEQDHSIEFWIAICHLQLNEYNKALNVLKNEIESQESEHGIGWVHYLDLFYLGIIYFELGDYNSAIAKFDKVLSEYSTFSDVQYYKSICLNRLGEKEKAKKLVNDGVLNYAKGNTFTEGSVNYEPYPYQVTWEWEYAGSIIK